MNRVSRSNGGGIKGPTSSPGHFAVALGLFILGYWMFRPSTTPTDARGTASPSMATPTPAANASPMSTPGSAYANEAEARNDAARLYPELTSSQTKFAQRFAALEARYRKERPDFFHDAGWPVTLAKELAANADSKP